MKKHFEKIKSEGTCIHRLDEELIRRRRDELRSALEPDATNTLNLYNLLNCISEFISI